jgi:hypothetical protein
MNMRRLTSISMAAAVLFGGASIALAQSTTTVVRPSVVPGPTYYSDYYKAPYYKPAPSRAEVAQILMQAGYQNPTDLSLDGDVWTGRATMNNHQVAIRFDRQGIWQLTP